jgi:serine/threonine protein kinase
MDASHKQKVEELFEAALDCATGERLAFLTAECKNHPAIINEVKSLLAARDAARAESFMQAPAFELEARRIAVEQERETFIGQSIGNYRIIERIGSGGMGTVYKAVRNDDEYRTEVAIKLIKRGMDTDYILKRFRRERQILANLNHPNIARLLEGGTTAEGLPYFVMEYIEGKTLIDYCDEKRFSLAKRLKLFRTICSAVQHAHQNLVIHRDIKPSNILITDDNTPKLLDFGIAKILQTDAPEALTATELKVLTPEYASPEQVRGEAVNVLSDVYSLGVVLYELLTGQRPYHFKNRRPDEIAKVICEHEPAKPSTAVGGIKTAENKARTKAKKISEHLEEPRAFSPEKWRRSLRGDLDNIVLMAMRKEPERRYATVAEFSEDVRRYLEGRPVLAHGNTFFYKSGKFISRNKIVATAAVLIALSLIFGVAATAWQAVRAERARSLAQRRLSDVRAMANSFIFEINDEIEHNPTRARQMLVSRAVEYLDKSAAEAENDSSLQSELATAYLKIGDVQSALYTANVGDSSGALESYGKALKINEAIYAAEPKNLSAGLNLSASCLKMGDISAKTGNIAASTDFYRRAVSLNEQFVDAEPAHTEARRQLADSLLRLGQSVFRTGELPEVLTHYRRSLAIYEQLAAENPFDSKARRSPAVVLFYVGFALNNMEERDEALKCFRQALEISEKILAADPDSITARRDVREFNHWFGFILRETGDINASLAHHQKSQSITRELLSADETNVEERNTLAESQLETGKTLAQAGRDAEALKSYQEAIQNYEQVHKTDVKNAHVRCQIAYAKLFFAETLARTGRTSQALDILGQTLVTFKDLTVEDPNNKEWQSFFALNYKKIGEVSLKQNETRKALENFRKAYAIEENLSAKSPSDIRRKKDLIITQNTIKSLADNMVKR